MDLFPGDPRRAPNTKSFWGGTPPCPTPFPTVVSQNLHRAKIPTGAREAFKKGQWASWLFGGPGHGRVSTLEKRYLHPLKLNLNHFGRWAWYKSLVLSILMKTRIAELKCCECHFVDVICPWKRYCLLFGVRWYIMFYLFQLRIGSFNFDVMQVPSSARFSGQTKVSKVVVSSEDIEICSAPTCGWWDLILTG